jgi:hypothetical protein
MVASIENLTADEETNASASPEEEEQEVSRYDQMDGPSEEEVYMSGEYKIILQLVGVLSHGKVAKRIADMAIDAMQDVQNLRKAIYESAPFFTTA